MYSGPALTRTRLERWLSAARTPSMPWGLWCAVHEARRVATCVVMDGTRSACAHTALPEESTATQYCSGRTASLSESHVQRNLQGSSPRSKSDTVHSQIYLLVAWGGSSRGSSGASTTKPHGERQIRTCGELGELGETQV